MEALRADDRVRTSGLPRTAHRGLCQAGLLSAPMVGRRRALSLATVIAVI